jgi:tetratricopeptide (TPR) repeat protein
MYYPFIDDHDREVIDSIIDAVDNYYEFIERLVDTVCYKDASESIAFLAAIHAAYSEDLLLIGRLKDMYGSNPLIMAWTFPTFSETDLEKHLDEFRDTLANAWAQNPPSWMTTRLHLLHGRYLHYTRPAVETWEVLSAAKDLIDSDETLQCFSSYFYYLEGSARRHEGDMVNATLSFTKGLESAREHGNIASVISLLLFLGILIVETNPTAAFEFVEEANVLATRLGIPSKIGAVRYYMGYACSVSGEYDLALRFFREADELIKTHRGTLDNILLNISRVYNILHDGENALEWIKGVYDCAEGEVDDFTAIQMAEALILLDRLDEVEECMNSIHRQTLEDGGELSVAFFNYITGRYELALGNLAEAFSLLEEAYSYSEKFPYGNLTTQTLLALTRAEMTSAERAISAEFEDDVSGPWMSRLEMHAERRNLPGVAMYAALLRGEFLFQQNQPSKAERVLQDALDNLDSPGVKILRDRIKALLNEIHA